MRLPVTFFAISFLMVSCSPRAKHEAGLLRLNFNERAGTISVFRSDGTGPLLVQNAKADIRPYIHPVIAPDGQGELTEYSPPHHKHQTGLYWGLKRLNGRDYFMNWKEDYWRRVSAEIVTETGRAVRWRTIYRLLDEKGDSVLTETQTWTFSEEQGRFVMDLHWEAEAHVDVTMEKFYVGGLFLRMPWRPGMEGDAVNSAGQRNGEAEGQRAVWCDIGLRLNGRSDQAHFTIMDHPENSGFPVAWRVDNELGIGPSRQILGDWSIAAGQNEVFRYRLVVYTGARDEAMIDRWWRVFVGEEDRL